MAREKSKKKEMSKYFVYLFLFFQSLCQICHSLETVESQNQAFIQTDTNHLTYIIGDVSAGIPIEVRPGQVYSDIIGDDTENKYKDKDNDDDFNFNNDNQEEYTYHEKTETTRTEKIRTKRRTEKQKIDLGAAASQLGKESDTKSITSSASKSTLDGGPSLIDMVGQEAPADTDFADFQSANAAGDFNPRGLTTQVSQGSKSDFGDYADFGSPVKAQSPVASTAGFADDFNQVSSSQPVTTNTGSSSADLFDVLGAKTSMQASSVPFQQMGNPTGLSPMVMGGQPTNMMGSPIASGVPNFASGQAGMMGNTPGMMNNQPMMNAPGMMGNSPGMMGNSPGMMANSPAMMGNSQGMMGNQPNMGMQPMGMNQAGVPQPNMGMAANPGMMAAPGMMGNPGMMGYPGMGSPGMAGTGMMGNMSHPQQMMPGGMMANQMQPQMGGMGFNQAYLLTSSMATPTKDVTTTITTSSPDLTPVTSASKPSKPSPNTWTAEAGKVNIDLVLSPGSRIKKQSQPSIKQLQNKGAGGSTAMTNTNQGMVGMGISGQPNMMAGMSMGMHSQAGMGMQGSMSPGAGAGNIRMQGTMNMASFQQRTDSAFAVFGNK